MSPRLRRLLVFIRMICSVITDNNIVAVGVGNRESLGSETGLRVKITLWGRSGEMLRRASDEIYLLMHRLWSSANR